ncbi:MAG: normocyte-binding protein [Clostridium sp.]|nr:normocyte-binding protein [Clostridium sp.]
MKDTILEKLSKMEDLEQRKILKDIMSGLFSNLIDYQEEAYKNLETRIYNEIEDPERKYDIYTTVCKKSDIDPVDEFLFPFFPEDVAEKKIDMKEILKSIHRKEKMVLFTIFLKCDYSTICTVNPNKRYKGSIVTDNGKYPISVCLERNQKYVSRIKELYEIFQKNEIPWRTVNSPYMNKFFDVLLVQCESFIDENEEIKEIVFDLEDFEEYKMIDVIPLWNVERLKIKSDGFPMPAIDKVNFEHFISTKKMGSENGYLVDEHEHIIRYIRREEDGLTIVSPEEKTGTWDVLMVSQQKDKNMGNNDMEISNNSRKVSFINKYANRQSLIIRTKGEIARIINSFEVSKKFELCDVEIKPTKNAHCITYDMNFFISDDIRVGNDKKVMVLRFRADTEESFITQDILSFLVSEIQMYFPEYECEGELI